MTGIMLTGGFLFWCAVAYFGTRNVLKQDGAALGAFLAKVKALPGGLMVPVVGGYIVGAWFLAGQIQAIAAKAGVIGPHFMAAIVCGMLASVCLAGLPGGPGD